MPEQRLYLFAGAARERLRGAVEVPRCPERDSNPQGPCGRRILSLISACGCLRLLADFAWQSGFGRGGHDCVCCCIRLRDCPTIAPSYLEQRALRWGVFDHGLITRSRTSEARYESPAPPKMPTLAGDPAARDEWP